MNTYIEVLKKFEKKHFCPFCNEQKQNMLEVKKYFYVIPARAQYCEDHILIVPKRHVCLLKALKKEELEEMMKLLYKWDNKLRKYYKNISLLLRDGISKEKIWKSVNHLHFHIIPDHTVYVMKDKDSENREFYDNKTYKELAEKMRKKFGKNKT